MVDQLLDAPDPPMAIEEGRVSSPARGKSQAIDLRAYGDGI